MSGDPFEQIDAAHALAQKGDFDGRTVLLSSLQHLDPEVRLRATVVLQEIGPAWAIDAVGGVALEDERSYVRNQAIFALMDIWRPAVVPWLIGVLDDEDSERREDARVALYEVLGDDVPVAADIDEEGEPEQVKSWWRRVSETFDQGCCYYRGNPISLGEWIASLGNSAAHRSWVLTRLGWWTGKDLGPSSSHDVAERWQRWWKENPTRFKRGRRYFHGFEVDPDASWSDG